MADLVQKPAATDPLVRIWSELRALGLESHVADLDAHGYTVIPPELAGPNGLADRLLEPVQHILRYDLPDFGPLAIPIIEDSGRVGGLGRRHMFGD